MLADALLLQTECRLGDDVPRRRRRRDGLDESAAPGVQQSSREEQVLLIDRAKHAVPHRSGPPSTQSEPLQERGDRGRSVQLDHPVQVADVDAQLERGGGHDHAVAALGESPLSELALTKRERRMHQVRGVAGTTRPEDRPKLLVAARAWATELSGGLEEDVFDVAELALDSLGEVAVVDEDAELDVAVLRAPGKVGTGDKEKAVVDG